MIILDKKYKVSELYEINSFANGFMKKSSGFVSGIGSAGCGHAL